MTPKLPPPREEDTLWMLRNEVQELSRNVHNLLHKIWVLEQLNEQHERRMRSLEDIVHSCNLFAQMRDVFYELKPPKDSDPTPAA